MRTWHGWIGIGAVLGLGAIAVGVALHRSTSAPPTGPTQPRGSLSSRERGDHAVLSELQDQRRELFALREAMREMSDRDSLHSPEPPPEIPEDDGEGVADDDPGAGPSERAADLAVALDAEPRDNTWASAVEADAMATVAAHGAGLVLQQVKCGSTMCRAALEHAAAGSVETDLDDVTFRPPFNTGGYVYIPEPQEGGKPESVLYFSREGESLPM